MARKGPARHPTRTSKKHATAGPMAAFQMIVKKHCGRFMPRRDPADGPPTSRRELLTLCPWLELARPPKAWRVVGESST